MCEAVVSVGVGVMGGGGVLEVSVEGVMVHG